MEKPFLQNEIKAEEIDFSLILNSLATREKNALKVLKIETSDDFCKCDFSQLYSIRGFGLLTVECLQKWQRQLLSQSKIGDDNLETSPSPTLHSAIDRFHFSTKELNALRQMGISTLENFLAANLETVFSLKGFGERTYNLLRKSKKQLIQELSVDLSDSDILLEEQSVFTLRLNPREKRLLVSCHISTLKEFALSDLLRLNAFPNCGAGTLNSLLSKQIEVRKLIQEKYTTNQPIAFDDELSLFLLRLSSAEKELLWNFDISRISEFLFVNLDIFKFASPEFADSRDALHRIQCSFLQEIKNTESILNDSMADISIDRLKLSGHLSDYLAQNNIDSLQNFLFFPISKEQTELAQLQFEYRCRYAPIKFLHRVPIYFDVVFHNLKVQCNDKEYRSFLDHFETSEDFLSCSYEKIMEITNGHLKITRDLLLLQYEMIATRVTSLEYLNCTNDDRWESWTQEVSKRSLKSMPFFEGAMNHGFETAALHESFLPEINLADLNIFLKKSLKMALQVGIVKLGDFLLTSRSHIQMLPHFSDTVIASIQARIMSLLLSPPAPRPLDRTSPETYLFSLLKGYVKSDMAINVLLRRMKGMSLDAIGRQYGLSRERIRQLEKKCKNFNGLGVVRSSFADLKSLLESALKKLHGFAHIQKIKRELAETCCWNENECTIYFVEFLLSRCDSITYHSYGYYSIRSYPCLKCDSLITAISNNSEITQGRYAGFLSTLSRTCCSKCIEQEHHITEDFLLWKSSSDSLFSDYFEDEKIYHSKKRSLKKMVFHVLKKSKKPLLSREILSIIYQHTKIENFTEKQIQAAAAYLCQSNNDFFLWDSGGIYAHRKHIPVDKPILIHIEARIRQALKHTSAPYISLYSLFNEEYKQDCKLAGIPSPFALHACLKAKKIEGITFMRSPYLCYSDQKQKRINLELLDRWIAQKRDIVNINALKQYAKEIGIDSFRFTRTFAYLTSVLRHEQEVIVHIDSLELDQKKMNQLIEVSYHYWKQCLSEGNLFARTDDLLNERESQLPQLGHGITWTSRLLFSLLVRSERIVVFGNTHLAFGFRDHKSAPISLGDIAVRVLRDKFNGRASLREFSTYFRNELRLVQVRLTSTMLQNHPAITMTEHEIHLSEDDNAS